MSPPSRPTTLVVARTLSQADFDAFARLSGDHNPIHVDSGYAAGTRFARTVAHGMLLGTILRGLAARLLPGARQRSEQLMFPAPTFAGEALRFTARVVAEEGAQVHLEVSVERADGTLTCSGTAAFERRPGPRG